MPTPERIWNTASLIGGTTVSQPGIAAHAVHLGAYYERGATSSPAAFRAGVALYKEQRLSGFGLGFVEARIPANVPSFPLYALAEAPRGSR